MTAPPPLDLMCKSPEELKTIIRNLEQSIGLMDAAAQKATIKLMSMGLREEKLEAVIKAAAYFDGWSDTDAMRDAVGFVGLRDAFLDLKAWDKAHGR